MKRRFGLYALLAVASAGCAESPVTQPLRSLEQNGEVSFFCGSIASGPPVGADINRCPDRLTGEHHLFALVTQTLRGEVALIDLDKGDEGEVVDVNPSVPGFSFLPVGEQPVDIVSTPGGTASFVAVAATGRAGIFALPTSCIGRPRAGEPARDITSWPACSLPVAPHDMTILVGPDEALGDPRCGRAAKKDPVDQTKLACPAVVNNEGGGVHKLAVTLPERGVLAIIDAQWLLNQKPGEFKECEILEHPLAVDLPATPIPQSLPADLIRDPSCPAVSAPTPASGSFNAFPVKQALGGGSLYIADLKAPVIHRLDVTDPCRPVPQPSLLPQSVEDPARQITVRDLAVSPETTRGQRFVYAIEGTSTGGTVPGTEERGGIMVFDVSPGSTNRTPLVRPGSVRTPYEPADRILFSAPARAVSFAERDVPEPDPVTGSITFGEMCDPNPVTPPEDPATRYRPALDLSRGAAPRKLRGIFGLAALSSGQVAVIDVEDLDAACRRPIDGNTGSEPDFRGCANDPVAEYRTNDPARPPTVSNEVSCNVIQPHRARMASYAITSDRIGLRAPTLRALPRLSSTRAGLLSDNTFEGRINPKLLAVDFEPTPTGQREPARVYVGTVEYTAEPVAGQSQEEILDLSPVTAQRNSLVLPLIEPRSYAGQEDFAVSYEGRITGDWQGGRWAPPAADGTIELRHSANFCDSGVEDQELMADWAARLQVADENDNHAKFGHRHADYVQLRSKLLGRDSRYWSDLEAQRGRSEDPELSKCDDVDYDICLQEFGAHDQDNLETTRDLRIREAYQSRLLLEPRDSDTLGSDGVQSRLKRLRCCFPEALTYTVRGGHQWIVRGSSSGFRHDVRGVLEGQEYRCRRDTCDPRLRYHRSRAFEISKRGSCPDVQPDVDDADGCIGPAGPEDYACIVPGPGPVQPGGEGSACIFENLTARFAIYRGDKPAPASSESDRDMTFTWQTVGGFTVLAANIVEETSSTSPRSMTFVPQRGQMAVVDGRLAGLTFISLSSLSVSKLYY
ncbi:MAG TPA: hypothetical protein VI072_02200 [Polyangiaceae bacterium]